MAGLDINSGNRQNPDAQRSPPLPPVIWVAVKAGTLVTVIIILLLNFLTTIGPYMPETQVYLYLATGLMIVLSLLLKTQDRPIAGHLDQDAMIRERRSLLFTLIVTEGFCVLALVNYLLVGELVSSLLLCAFASIFSRPFFPKPEP